jgi:hypothetical protein
MFTVFPTRIDKQDKQHSSKNSYRFHIFGIKNYKKNLFGKQFKQKIICFAQFVAIHSHYLMETGNVTLT